MYPFAKDSKQCRDCSRVLSLDRFSPSKKNPDGATSYCRDCLNVRHGVYRVAAAAKKGLTSTPRRKKRPGFKWCPDCEKELRVAEFGNNRTMSDGLTGYCRPCHNKRVRAARERAGGSRAYHLPRRYGITVAQYDEMFEKQGGLCDLCHERKAEHVDHCHETKTVRALLCFNCNQGLGNFMDNEATMLAAAEYVVRHRGGAAQAPVDVLAAARFRALFATAA